MRDVWFLSQIVYGKIEHPLIINKKIDWNTTSCSFSKLGNMWLRNERTTKQWCLIAMPYGNISWYKDWLVTCTIFQYNFHFRDSAIYNFQGLNFRLHQRYKYRLLQTIQMKLILLCVWAEPAVLGSTKTALKLKDEIFIG